MKTGIRNHIDKETFYVTILGLDCLLKRAGFKDSVLFKNHNNSYIMNPELFASGVYFNLFSEYGIGKKLEFLLIDLFKNETLEYEKYKDNIFYKEILKLSESIIPLIRDFDPVKEHEFSYKYAIENICKVDELSRERLERLISLFEKLSDIIYFSDDEKEEVKEFCNCGFCNEFRKYNYPKTEHINKTIMNVLDSLRSF